MQVKKSDLAALRAAPRLRRAYFESRFGQLHVHNAIPPGGGFEEGTTLLCAHGSGETGRVFVPLMPQLGAGRSVYAPDLPGCGESDPLTDPPTPPTLEASVGALLDFVTTMRLRQIDLMGQGSGAQVVRALAVRRPELVRRVVLLGAPPREGAAPPQPSLDLADSRPGPATVDDIADFLD